MSFVIGADGGPHPLDAEVWYPAAAALHGRDLEPASQDRYELFPGLPPTRQKALRDAEPADQRVPLVLVSHGGYSHRRAATELCTHLATHGYAVAAIDHPGGTLADMIHDLGAADPANRRSDLAADASNRPRDIGRLLDFMGGSGLGPLSGRVETERVGMTGTSLGGWTTLAMNQRNERIHASLPMVPAWGRTNLGDVGPGELDLGGWNHEIPTLLLVAEWDGIVQIEEMRRLHATLPEPKRFVNLLRGGHVHFADGAALRHEMIRKQFAGPSMQALGAEADFARAARAMRPFAEHCPAEHGLDVARGCALAHFDASLRGVDEAAAFLGEGMSDRFAARGIEIETG